jgi:DNA-binding NtrC family response regulator
LLVEDTKSLSLLYQATLEKAGHKVSCAYLAKEAREAHAGAQGRLVLLDLMLPDGDGLDLLKEMRAADPAGKVIVITANGSINRAVDAMRGGAFDFLVKPFDDRRLLAAVENASAAIAADRGATRPEPDPEAEGFHGFIGTAPEMREIYRLISEIGRSTATVFITGESGTGKEVAAEAIHRESARVTKPFIALNCGAIPRDLLESEVFGHLRGSFTGAIADKQGAAAAADGGTLFLDEICEMDLGLQTKLLRFLQTSTISPVGATSPRKVDARIICATNRDPIEEVRAGRFREDLFYRLHVVPIHLPPLRQRGEDIVRVAEAFLTRFARREGKSFRRLSDDVKQVLRNHRWPGNVRQLQNVIWNTVLLHDAETVESAMLPGGLQDHGQVQPMPSSSVGPVPSSSADPIQPLLGMTMAEIERHVIEATIAAQGGSVPQAARVLDLSPSTIYRKLEGWAKATT